MAKLLLNLRNVPEDEANEVRALMEEHRIDCYETPPSAFLVSAGGIWVRDDGQFARAKDLLEVYQAERARRVREEYQRRRRAGEAPTLWSMFAANPVRILVFVGLSAGILLLLATVVVQLGR